MRTIIRIETTFDQYPSQKAFHAAFWGKGMAFFSRAVYHGAKEEGERVLHSFTAVPRGAWADGKPAEAHEVDIYSTWTDDVKQLARLAAAAVHYKTVSLDDGVLNDGLKNGVEAALQRGEQEIAAKIIRFPFPEPPDPSEASEP